MKSILIPTILLFLCFSSILSEDSPKPSQDSKPTEPTKPVEPIKPVPKIKAPVTNDGYTSCTVSKKN